MDNFSYCTPTRYIFGKDTESQTGTLVKEYLDNPSKILLVYGQGSVIRSGLLNRVKDSIGKQGIDILELGGVKPNPTDDRVYEGIDLCRSEQVQAVVAVGGGSAIDTAKAIALGTLYDGDFWDFYAGKLPATKALPIGVVLTIPAAGSEGSGNSVITKKEGMHKISLRSDYALRPKFAVLNPELTYTLPPEQTVAGVSDMMAHIMERYFTPTQGVEVTDRISEGLLRAIMEVAPIVLKEPTNYDARANIMWAGTLAHNGICGCGKIEDWVSHFMEHELSALYGVTHGTGLAVVFPAWLTFMAHHKPLRVKQFAMNVMGVTTKGDDLSVALEGIEKLKMFYKSIGLPVKLKELGIENPEFDELVRKLHENKGDIIGGYYRLTDKDTIEIYKLMV